MRARRDAKDFAQARGSKGRPGTGREKGVRALSVVAASLAVFGVLASSPTHAAVQQDAGEGRPLTRDPQRVYQGVAGEADAASTVVNPGGLGQLRAIGGVLDVGALAPVSRGRGSGGGLFLAVPVPFGSKLRRLIGTLVVLGFGAQLVCSKQPEAGVEGRTADNRFGKFTLSAGIPLDRWLRGLSVGLSYSWFSSTRNAYADGLREVSVGLSAWLHRSVALGFVGRTLNQPSAQGETQPLVLEPEIAIRPFGTRAFELAAGARIHPLALPGDPPFGVPRFQPRGRLFVGAGALRWYVEAERYFAWDLNRVGRGGSEAVRVSTGVAVDFSHVGLALGPLLGLGQGQGYPLSGGAFRLRLSAERYASLAKQPRQVLRVDLGAYSEGRGLYEVVALLDRLAGPQATVLLETKGHRFEWAELEEVREAVLRVRERGGKVIAFMDGGGLSSYFVASAADRILVDPATMLHIRGIDVQALYYGDLLAKLGAKAEFVRIAEYKSTPEAYERSGPSEPARRQRDLFYGDIWNHVLRLVARERGRDPLGVKEWIDAAPHRPEDALRLGIVDGIARRNELDGALERLLARRVRIEPPPKASRPPHADTYGLGPKVAIVHIEGELLDGKSATIPLLRRKIAGDQTLVQAIENAREDRQVRAVVVRITSPGGSLSAAESIARALDSTRKVKPVVVSLGAIAASGGYYIATAGQRILADATTLTGSIGIFYPKVDLSGTLAKLGIGVDELSFGAHAAMRSPWRGYSEADRAAVLRDIQHGYDGFVGRVAQARSMQLEQVDAVARGRVWSGVRALEVGLVDEYGGLNEAVSRARRLAGLRADVGEVIHLPPVPGPIERLENLFALKIPRPGTAEATGERSAAEAILGALLGGLDGDVFGSDAFASGPGAGGGLAWVLRWLPISIWMTTEPKLLALQEEHLVVR